MMQRLLLSLAVVAAVGGGTLASTGAFFNDTETSTGNTFAAGDIDLQIDNESYIQATSTQGAGPSNLLVSEATSWAMADLVAGTHHFFDFSDLKPGDLGEDTISLHLGSNDGYLCAAARVTTNSDMSCTEPENTDEGNACVVEGIGGSNGDLAAALNFGFWNDDGDNVLEVGENVFLSGPLSGLGQQGKIALADTSGSAPFGTSVAGGSTIYIGKAWCFGTLAPAPVAQDGLGKTGTNGPLVRGTGVSCSGAAVIDNKAQTDEVIGDMQFYAVQSRNNATFTCAQDYPGFVQS